MLVIRPSVHKKNRPPSQQFTRNPVIAQASTITTTTTKLPNFTNTVLHLDTAASTSTGKIVLFLLLPHLLILIILYSRLCCSEREKKTAELKCRYRVMTAKCVLFFLYLSLSTANTIRPFILPHKTITVSRKIRFVEPGCTHNTMASNNATEFRHETETNAMGESTIVAPKTKANKKEANCIDATGISEAAANIPNDTTATAAAAQTTINGNNNQFNFPVDQTKANPGTADVYIQINYTFLIYVVCAFCFAFLAPGFFAHGIFRFFLIESNLNRKKVYCSIFISIGSQFSSNNASVSVMRYLFTSCTSV